MVKPELPPEAAGQVFHHDLDGLPGQRRDIPCFPLHGVAVRSIRSGAQLRIGGGIEQANPDPGHRPAAE